MEVADFVLEIQLHESRLWSDDEISQSAAELCVDGGVMSKNVGGSLRTLWQKELLDV